MPFAPSREARTQTRVPVGVLRSDLRGDRALAVEIRRLLAWLAVERSQEVPATADAGA